MKPLIVLALIASIALPVHAQDLSGAEMGKPDPNLVVAGTYAIDPNHSHVVYQVSHFGISNYTGMVGGLSGKLQIDPKDPEHCQVEVEIPLSGLVSTSTALDAHLKTSDFFDAEKFPKARFKSRSVKVDGTEAVISGLLTIRNITKPVELRTHLVGVAVNPMSGLLTVGFEATTQIKRSEFGISYYVPHISDEVELHINVAFEDID